MDLPDVSGLTMVNGAGGLPKLVVDLPTCTGELYLHGAQLTAWIPTGHDPVLWLSPLAEFVEGGAIRGGVPICFPWFGAGPTGDLSPAHGLARTGPWRLTQANRVADALSVTLQLHRADVEDRRGAEHWNSDFLATYTVTFGKTLTMTLDVEPAQPPTQAALHAYLQVGDIHQIEIDGLDQCQYFDKLTGDSRVHQGTVAFTGETDRVFEHSSTVTLTDLSLERRVTVHKTGSPQTVVWNPWVAKTAATGDLSNDAWQQFVCLEPANLTHALHISAELSVERI